MKKATKTKTRNQKNIEKPANLDNFTLYLNILKAIYEKGSFGATRQDITEHLEKKLKYCITRQSLHNIMKNIETSPYFKNYIDFNKDKKTIIYTIKADFKNDDFLRFFADEKYNYDEFLALHSLNALSESNVKELTEEIKNNFKCLDNPLVDTKMSIMEQRYAKKIFSLINKKLKATIKMKGGFSFEVIFLKLIYSDKNWYALVKLEDEKIVFKRLAFIEEINEIIGSNYSNFDIPFDIDEKLNKLNNALSDYNNLNYAKIAKLEISEDIERYFYTGMKKFFKYQEIIQTNPLVIEIQYTSDLEILRFIRNWLPKIKILEPKSLQKSFKDDLDTALNQYN